MAFETLVEPLRQVDIFSGLSEPQLQAIARGAERVIYQPGSVIVRQSDASDAAILVISGEAFRVAGVDHDGRPQPIPRGAVLAEMAMLIDTKSTSTIVARSMVRAMRFSRTMMLELMLQDRDLTERLTDKITGRLTSLAKQLRRLDKVVAAPNRLISNAASKAALPNPLSLRPHLH